MAMKSGQRRGRLSWLLALLVISSASGALAAELPVYHLTIKDGTFEPAVIKVPAHTRFKLVISNQGPGPEEFESRELRKETVLAPGVTRTVVFAALRPGSYRFFGEFHPETAQGKIVVK